jgi:2,4-diaminopentanoate dehydrogenase
MDVKPLPPSFTDEQSTRDLRIAQWSTGTIGAHALRAVIEHPHMSLAGVCVHGEGKVGRDAGELCGTASTGVTATASIDDIIELEPDCVLYMPNAFNLDELCRLLAAGINVVTTCGAFHHPPSMDPEIRARVQAACELGGTSVHSTGSSPGFITEAVPLVLTSIQRQLTALTIDEYADLSQRNSPELLFGLMGFGRPAGPFRTVPRRLPVLEFRPVAALGRRCDRGAARLGGSERGAGDRQP